MSNPLVTINLVVLNGEKYIPRCLDGVLAQTYPKELIEFNILDNGSTDGTIKSIKGLVLGIKGIPRFNFVESKLNLGMWPGQEELLKHSNGKYVLGLCVDVILDKNFIKNAVEIMENDLKIGALQAKIYKYSISELLTTGYLLPTVILDTCGFKIFKSRRLINIGHGEEDNGQYDNLSEIFGVEGACPFFRRETIESCKIQINMDTMQKDMVPMSTEIFDHDYFWYGDDLDFAWRMNLLGWKQVFAPTVIAWHDRQTTKSLKKNWLDYVLRVPIRHQISLKKRRLDWRNTRWTIIKNDYIINILKDSPFIIAREVAVFGYTLLFEPKVFLEAGNFFRLLPKMLRKRREIMKKAVKKSEEIHKYFQ
ncbi:MAG: glycosyltransferase family 2 protein [bacterium]|nr:glycosyltransferase family 2 protein [bacterium]